jgi:hypothetical protein
MLHRGSAATTANLHVHRTCTLCEIPGHHVQSSTFKYCHRIDVERNKRAPVPNRQSCPCQVDPVHVAAMRHGKRSLDMCTAEWF